MKTNYQLMQSLGLLLGISLGACAHADALLSGNLTADNGFFAYISTDNSILGTEIASGSNWGTAYSFSNVNLVAGQNYFLQVEAIDWGQPNGFIGSFSLSNSQFQFANGSQSLSTDTLNWAASPVLAFSQATTPQPWFAPTGTPVDFGTNGVGPWGARAGIDTGAQWIWSSTYNGTALLSTQITAATSPVPVPQSLIMFASGLIGLVFSRRKENQA